MHYEKVSFPEAVEMLAKKLSINIPRETKPTDILKTGLWEINQKALSFFRNNLWKTNDGKKALLYLSKRGISQNTAQEFLLGYAPRTYNALIEHMRGQKISLSALEKAGLISSRGQKGYADMFREKIIIPILDMKSKVIGFGARKIREDDPSPKYINTPENPVYSKRLSLFNINLAKNHIIKENFCIIVEGYMDVLMAHQYGRQNVVASMGTALTEKQVRVVKKLTKKLVLALDADVAGDQAALRGLEVAQEAFDRRTVPVPTWRGWIRYEAQLDADIRVATLPTGFDPDEVIKRDVAEWDALIAQALPVVEYYLQAVISRFDLNSPKGKAEAAREILPLIQEIGSPVERTHYLQRLARLLRVDERTLQQEMESRKVTHPKPMPALERAGRLSAQPGLTFGVERYALLLLLKRPELLTSMNDTLVELGLGPLGEHDFALVAERALFKVIAECITQHGNLDMLHQDMDPSLRQVLDELLALVEEVVFPSDEQAKLDASRCALRLRELYLRRRNEELRYLQEDARAQGDADAVRQWGRMVDKLAMELAAIQREKAAHSSLRISPTRAL